MYKFCIIIIVFCAEWILCCMHTHTERVCRFGRSNVVANGEIFVCTSRNISKHDYGNVGEAKPSSRHGTVRHTHCRCAFELLKKKTFLSDLFCDARETTCVLCLCVEC